MLEFKQRYPQNQNKKYFFFYDETDNARRVFIKDNTFNDFSNNKVFTLGGIMSKNNKVLKNFDFENFKKKLNLENNNDIKFKDIFPKHKNFLTTLDSPNFYFIFNSLIENNLYIHYFSIDLLYYSLVDIIDSIASPLIYDISFNLYYKEQLYLLVKNNIDSFNTIACKFNYPNIEKKNLRDFYISLKKLNNNFCPNLNALFDEKLSKISFLAENSTNDTIENFKEFYFSNVLMFPSSKHFFDEEQFIQKQIKIIEESKNNILSEINYSFIKSHNSEFIQISDIIVTIIKQYYKYLINEDFNFKNLSTQQAKNLILFFKVLIKSNNISPELIHTSFPNYVNRKSSLLFDFHLSLFKNINSNFLELDSLLKVYVTNLYLHTTVGI